MGKFKEEIIALNAQAGNMSEEKFNQKVLASVAAHLAETTQQEDSYYTHLAKFELTIMSKTLEKPTVISSFLASDIDPLEEVRTAKVLLQETLSNSLAQCVVELKDKMEKQALSYERMAKEYNEIIAENQSDASASTAVQHKLTKETLDTLASNATASTLQAKQIRAQAALYDTYKIELESFFTTPSNVLSKEASMLLGQLRRYISTVENLPKSFADWGGLTLKALSSPKTNATVMASITSLLKATNSYQAAIEKGMRNRMVERTTLNDLQQILAHISQKASDINEEKNAVAQKASTAQEELLKARQAERDAAERVKAAEQKLEQEIARKRLEENMEAGNHVTLSHAANGLAHRAAFDTGSVVSFATYKTTRSSRNIAKGLIETSAITDGQNMEQHAGWTHSKVVILQNLRLQYNLELSKEENGNGTLLPTVTTNGHTHRGFIGRGEKMSARMFSFIEELADETISPLNVIKALDKHYPNLEVTQTLARIQKTYTQDLEDADELPGFIINKNASQDDVKMMYYKVSMLSNMWGNDEELSMLPYNKDKAEKYGKMAEDMERKYTYLVKNRNEKSVVTSTVTNK